MREFNRRRCLFCSASADSKEHAIPKWVGKRLGLKGEKLWIGWARDVTIPPRQRHQPIMFGSHRARILCSGCNNHFKHLEDEALGLIEWMARGRAVRLRSSEQDIIASWGAKTGYCLIAASAETFYGIVPDEHPRHLRDAGYVHPLTWVGYASWAGHINSVIASDIIEGTAEGKAPHSYGVVFTFGHLALKVFGIRESLDGYAFDLDTSRLRQVAPRLSRALSWPTVPYQNEQLREFMETIPLLRQRRDAGVRTRLRPKPHE